jgi:RNA ligase (TIGR02306 family)
VRKLATIQVVNEVRPIDGADAIEVARILGWNVVVKKGEFEVGQEVVYCEVDSLLPESDEFEFLRKGCFKPAILDGETVVQRAGFRIKTMRLRGQVSQGICFPVSILPSLESRKVGDEVTDKLGIIKYEPPIPVGMSGRVKGAFPGFISKTDEIRVQVLDGTLERHRGKLFYVTEKVDGTSFSAFLRDGEFGICSRNLWMDETDESNLLVKIARQFKLEEKLQSIQARHGFDPGIQGEVIGPGVQKNKYKLATHELRVFSLVDLNESKWVDHATMLTILEEADLLTVPQLETIELNHTVDELVEYAQAKSVLADIQREGVVLRPLSEEYDQDVGSRLSFKVINPKFLLKFDE